MVELGILVAASHITLEDWLGSRVQVSSWLGYFSSDGCEDLEEI